MIQLTLDVSQDEEITAQFTVGMKPKVMIKNLSQAEVGKEYIIKDVAAADQALVNFLFTLGCFKGEVITVISVLSGNYVISIKDARYSIDAELASAILL